MMRLPRGPRLKRYVPALYQRNFLLFWSGQGASLIGTWMQNVGQAWLVLQLTNSPLDLGIVSSVQFLPVLLLSVFAGPFVDRLPKRKVLLLTQGSLMALAFTLSLITYLHVVRYRDILALSLLLGLVNTLDVPTRQSFIVELTGRENLMNAISLNSTAFNLARIFGPAVAGLLIGAIGIAPCFLLNGFSFLAVIVSLLFIDAPDRRPAGARIPIFRGVMASMGAGLRYVGDNARIAFPLLLMALLSIFVLNFNVVVPAFAKLSLGRDAAGYGLLMTSMGLGSFAAGVMLTLRSSGGPGAGRLVAGALGMSAFFAACGLARSYPLACLLLALSGFFTIVFTASCNAYVQTQSTDAMRGRVMSVYSLAFGGVTPIGSLYAGTLVALLGAGACMVVSGAVGILAAASIGLGAGRRWALPPRG